MSLFVTQADSLSVSTSCLSFTILFWPSQFPLPPSLPSYLLPPSFLPRRSLSASQHIPRAGRGVWSEPLQLSLSPFSLSVLFPFSRSLSVDSPLSHRNGLHYLPSSPSSKMTFSDFTKARQFNSVKSLQSEKENGKKKNKFSCHVRYINDITGQKELVSSVIHHHRSASCGY